VDTGYEIAVCCCSRLPLFQPQTLADIKRPPILCLLVSPKNAILLVQPPGVGTVVVQYACLYLELTLRKVAEHEWLFAFTYKPALIFSFSFVASCTVVHPFPHVGESVFRLACLYFHSRCRHVSHCCFLYWPGLMRLLRHLVSCTIVDACNCLHTFSLYKCDSGDCHNILELYIPKIAILNSVQHFGLQ
jgi:hypothetical protein